MSPLCLAQHAASAGPRWTRAQWGTLYEYPDLACLFCASGLSTHRSRVAGREAIMGKAFILWLLGVPFTVLVVLWAVGILR